MIRCRADEPVFDLPTDRYLEYEREQPGDSLERWSRRCARRWPRSARTARSISCCRSLPVQPPRCSLPVPQGFGEAVEQAKAEKRPGDLELLAEEARGFEWETWACAWSGGRSSRWVRTKVPVSPGRPCATSTVTTISKPTPGSRRSTRSWAIWSLPIWPCSGRSTSSRLAGAIAPSCWRWAAAMPRRGGSRNGPTAGDARRAAALRSAWLDKSADAYEEGFAEDRNHFYSGLNALALRTVETELAAALPEVWAERFDDDAGSGQGAGGAAAASAKLAVGVELSLASARAAAGADRQQRHLDRPERGRPAPADLDAATRGRQRLSQGAGGRARLRGGSARQQLELYRDLGVRSANVEAALAAFPPPAPPAPAGPRPRVVAVHRAHDRCARPQGAALPAAAGRNRARRHPGGAAGRAGAARRSVARDRGRRQRR